MPRFQKSRTARFRESYNSIRYRVGIRIHQHRVDHAERIGRPAAQFEQSSEQGDLQEEMSGGEEARGRAPKSMAQSSATLALERA